MVIEPMDVDPVDETETIPVVSVVLIVPPDSVIPIEPPVGSVGVTVAESDIEPIDPDELSPDVLSVVSVVIVVVLVVADMEVSPSSPQPTKRSVRSIANRFNTALACASSFTAR